MSPAITQVFPAAAASLAEYSLVSLFSLGIAVCAHKSPYAVGLHPEGP